MEGVKMGFTNYLENKLLDHVFGGNTYTKPLTIEIGLSTTPLGDDGTGFTEPNDVAYERIIVDNAIYDPDLETGFWNAAETATGGEHKGKGVKISAAPVEFPAAEEDWGTVTHFFITDGTNVLGAGELVKSKTVQEGDVVMFDPGDLVITLD